MRDKRKERRDRATIFPSVGKVADEGKGRSERRDKGGEREVLVLQFSQVGEVGTQD